MHDKGILPNHASCFQSAVYLPDDDEDVALPTNHFSPWLPACPTAKFLLDLNAKRSAKFINEPYYSARVCYAKEHPTRILAFKCMDSRLSLEAMTGLPTGAINPFRNTAGHFDLGWSMLRDEVTQEVEAATKKGQRTIALCTYHYSKGCNEERGCRGMGFNLDASRQCAEHLAMQFQEVFEGGTRAALVPIVVGIETDTEGLVFHAYDEQSHIIKSPPISPGVALSLTPLELCTWDFANIATLSEGDIRIQLQQLYRGLDEQLVHDILPVLMGNVHHVRQRLSAHSVPISFTRRETVIAVGVGFDWLHVPNKALIVGPFDHGWGDAVARAATSIERNIDSGSVNAEEDGIVLIASCYSMKEPGSWEWRMAEMTSRYFARTSMEALEAQGSLLSKVPVHVLVGVVERATLRFHIVPLIGAIV